MNRCSVILSLPLFVCAELSGAPIIDFRPPPAERISTPCASKGQGAVCITTPYIQNTLMTGFDVVFNKVDSAPRVGAGIPYPAQHNLFYEAWNNWDNAAADKGGGGGGGIWQLLDGTNGGANDLGGTIQITFSSQIWQTDPPGPPFGGVSIRATMGVTGVPKLAPGERLVWAQGLYVSYNAGAFTTTNNAGRPGPDLSNQTQLPPPAFFMDILTPCGSNYNINVPGGAINSNVDCPPAYPFTDPFNDVFTDRPSAGYPDFFAAEAFIGAIDYNAKTLKIFYGIDYGFNNTVVIPEPGTLGLTALAIGLLVAVLRIQPGPSLRVQFGAALQ